MGKIIAVHSYKGGTGKTLMSINLAAIYVKRGRKVCLLDLDFRAPSLQARFKTDGNGYWLNDYLNGACEIGRVLTDLTHRCDGGGKLLVGLANPATEAIREISAKDRKWEMRALGRLLSLKNSLLDEKGMDYLILDTSPGLQYSSINAIVSADAVVVVSILDRSDLEGTKRMIHELYDLFEKKTGILLNKVVIESLSGQNERQDLLKKYERTYNLPVLNVIPCYCDVSRAGGTYIFTKEKPEHPFTKILEETATKIEKF